ncbi:MAG: molybdopterin-guanine dinucleotide biosynthesis protein B [Deltaproteobacteria bacterium]|nr:MAG: molybdopterin-guanine dinucleotide biosynthesis protein B [Deltaproteobacteria bacterium]
MPPVVTFIGCHNSGKTTAASAVVSYLKEQGFKVGVIKSSSKTQARFDSPDTDTGKHKLAGADSVMFAGPDQMVLQTEKTDLSLITLVHRYFSDMDIVIGEGFKNAKKVPKIEVMRDKKKSLKGQVNGIIAVVTDCGISGDYVFRPHEKEEIAMFIEKRFLGGGAKAKEKTALLVNGRKVPINGFIQELLAGSISGMVASLKAAKKIKHIEIRVELGK